MTSFLKYIGISIPGSDAHKPLLQEYEEDDIIIAPSLEVEPSARLSAIFKDNEDLEFTLVDEPIVSQVGSINLPDEWTPVRRAKLTALSSHENMLIKDTYSSELLKPAPAFYDEHEEKAVNWDGQNRDEFRIEWSKEHPAPNDLVQTDDVINSMGLVEMRKYVSDLRKYAHYSYNRGTIADLLPSVQAKLKKLLATLAASKRKAGEWKNKPAKKLDAQKSRLRDCTGISAADALAVSRGLPLFNDFAPLEPHVPEETVAIFDSEEDSVSCDEKESDRIHAKAVGDFQLFTKLKKPVYVSLESLESRKYVVDEWEEFDVTQVQLWGTSLVSSSYFDRTVGFRLQEDRSKVVSFPKGLIDDLIGGYWSYLDTTDLLSCMLVCHALVKNMVRPIAMTPTQYRNCLMYAPLVSYFSCYDEKYAVRSIIHSKFFSTQAVHAAKSGFLLTSLASSIVTPLLAYSTTLAVFQISFVTGGVLAPFAVAAGLLYAGRSLIDADRVSKPRDPILGAQAVKISNQRKPGAIMSEVPGRLERDHVGFQEAIPAGIVVENFKPLVYGKSKNNDKVAVDKRILSKSAFEPDDKLWDEMTSWVIRNFPKLFPGAPFRVEEMKFEDWLKGCNSNPMAKKTYETAHQDLKKANITSSTRLTKQQLTKWSRNRAFTKREFLLTKSVLGDDNKAPRLIQGCMPELICLTSPWFAALSGLIKRIWNKKHFLYFASGRTANEVADYIGKAQDSNSFGENDVSNWDGSYPLRALYLEFLISSKLGAPRAVLDLLRYNSVKRGSTPFGIHYSCLGGRSSGIGCTSVFNSVINGLLHAFIFAKERSVKDSCSIDDIEAIFEDSLFAVQGDDDAFSHTGGMIDFKTWFSKFGFKSVAKYRPTKSAIEFCSSRLTRVLGGYTFVPKIGRIFSKMGYSLQAQTPRIAASYVKSSALSMFDMSRGIPPLKSYVDCTLRLLKDADQVKLPDEPWRMIYKDTNMATHETWADLHEQYGWTTTMQSELDKFLDTLYEAPVAVTNPLLELFCRMDSDKEDPMLMERVVELDTDASDLIDRYPGTPDLGVDAGFADRPSSWVRDLTREGIEPNPGPKFHFERATLFRTSGAEFKFLYALESTDDTLTLTSQIDQHGHVISISPCDTELRLKKYENFGKWKTWDSHGIRTRVVEVDTEYAKVRMFISIQSGCRMIFKYNTTSFEVRDMEVHVCFDSDVTGLCPWCDVDEAPVPDLTQEGIEPNPGPLHRKNACADKIDIDSNHFVHDRIPTPIPNDEKAESNWLCIPLCQKDFVFSIADLAGAINDCSVKLGAHTDMHHTLKRLGVIKLGHGIVKVNVDLITDISSAQPEEIVKQILARCIDYKGPLYDPVWLDQIKVGKLTIKDKVKQRNVGLDLHEEQDGWIEDLTEEGIEPNPGPGVAAAERALARFSEMNGATKAGEDWLIAAVDPYHDRAINCCGKPDGTQMASIVQCVKQTANITAPAATPSTGTWNVGFMTTPWMNAMNVEGTTVTGSCYATSTASGTSTIPIGSIVAKTISSTVSSTETYGYSITQAAATASASALITLPIDTSYLTGSSRAIATGFEVTNTSATLQLQGNNTCWRQPMPDIDTNTAVATCLDSFPTVNTVPVAVAVCAVPAPPPTSAEAMDLPGSRQWKAADGWYGIKKLIKPDAKPVSNKVVVGVIKHSLGSLVISPNDSLALPPTVTSTGGGETWLSYTYTFWDNMDQIGSYFEGLAPNNALTLTSRVYIERFPDVTNVQLVVLAKPSPRLDTAIIELYSEIVQDMPVAVPVGENGLGDWFKEAVSSVASYIKPALGAVSKIASSIPHPYAKALGAGAGMLDSFTGAGQQKQVARKELVVNPPRVDFSTNSNQKVSSADSRAFNARKKKPTLRANMVPAPKARQQRRRRR